MEGDRIEFLKAMVFELSIERQGSFESLKKEAGRQDSNSYISVWAPLPANRTELNSLSPI